MHHLAQHSVRQREDGSYVWKFDNNVRLVSAQEWNYEQTQVIFSSVPTLFVSGAESYGSISNPDANSLIKALRPQRVAVFEDAAHWVHHDQIDGFTALLRGFLGAD